METNSEAKLELDPDVMVNKEVKQDTTSIDKKYGVSLFQDKDSNYDLYQYDSVNGEIYKDDTSYKLDIDSNQFAQLYTAPEVYPVDTSVISVDYTKLIYIVLILQIFVFGYFVMKIIKVRGRYEQSNNQD